MPSARRGWATVAKDGLEAHAVGWALFRGAPMGPEELARWCLDRWAHGLAPEAVAELAGNWALACGDGRRAVLVADHIRSFPLLYSLRDGVAHVSDESTGLLDGTEQVDRDSALEFAAAGYVTGPHTLYAQLSGVQSGEIVTLDAAGAHRRDWFTHQCAYGEDATDGDSRMAALCAEHGSLVRQAVERALAGLGDRQIVVPLSGGLDSRLVASTLSRLGRKDTLCFTYGLEENFEARQAEETASRLGLPWVPVAYSPTDLRGMVADKDYARYQEFACAGVSFPHPDDWPAVRQLRESGLVKPGAVFFPGHTGDFICGSHLKYLFDPEENGDPLDFFPAMIRKHYALWERLARQGREVFSRRMVQSVGGVAPCTEADAARAYEFWEWRERQSKFIINSVRVYEFFGFDWRVPLWDREYMRFWQRPSIALKLDKHLYRACLEADDPAGVFTGVGRPRFEREAVAARVAAKAGKLSRRLRRGVGRIPVLGRLAWYLGQVKRHGRDRRKHPSGFIQAVGGWRYQFLHPGKRHVLSLLVKDFLERRGAWPKP